MMRIDLNETAKVLEDSDDILLLCHSHPDGDTLGSASALARALIAEGKRVRVECGDKIPKDFAFMFDGMESFDFEPKFIAAIDIADTKLLGKDFEGKYADRVDLCIDHHGSNMLYADKVWLEPDSASTAEMIYLLLAARGDEITPDIASCLFTGVTTDTGCFRFSNTTVRTYEIAAKLAELGADTYNIIQVFFETKTKTYAALERLALDSMRMYSPIAAPSSASRRICINAAARMRARRIGSRISPGRSRECSWASRCVSLKTAAIRPPCGPTARSTLRRSANASAAAVTWALRAALSTAVSSRR